MCNQCTLRAFTDLWGAPTISVIDCSQAHYLLHKRSCNHGSRTKGSMMSKSCRRRTFSFWGIIVMSYPITFSSIDIASHRTSEAILLHMYSSCAYPILSSVHLSFQSRLLLGVHLLMFTSLTLYLSNRYPISISPPLPPLGTDSGAGIST